MIAELSALQFPAVAHGKLTGGAEYYYKLHILEGAHNESNDNGGRGRFQVNAYDS